MVKMINNIKKNPIFGFIIVIQILFILLIFVKACIVPGKIISVNMESFGVDGEISYIEDGRLYFFNNGSIDDNNKLNITTENISVPSGAYRVTVEYDSTINENRRDEINADITMSSQRQISFDQISLDDQNNIITGELWTPFYNGCDDLKINISYNGKGILTINKITLTESLAYRFIRVIGFISLFLLIDICILIFFTNKKSRIGKKHMILLLIITASSLPFFSKALFGGHDLACHLVRIVSVAKELGNGQFPVRMATELNNGYSYPWPIYYCDIFLYPVALLYRMSVPLRVCYQVYVVFINSVTTIFTYLAIGKLTKNTSIKLVGTGLYVLCIYRLVNINIRSATGEYTAMTFLPLIVAGLYLIYVKESTQFKDWIYLAAGMSGVIMSHVITGEMIAVNIILFCLVFIKKTLKKGVLLSLLKSVLLTIGITAWFWIPFIDYYMHHVTVVQNGDLRLLEETTTELIYIFQLLSPGKELKHYITIGMPLIVGIGIVLFGLAKFRRSEKVQKINTLRAVSGFAFLNLLLVSDIFPWGQIQNLLGTDGLGYQIGTIQFVWRFLSIASVLIVFAIVIALDLMDENSVQGIKLACFGLVGCIVITVGFFYYRFTDETEGRLTYNIMQPYVDSDNLYLLNGTDRSIQNLAVPRVVTGNVNLTQGNRSDGIYKVHAENKDNYEAVVSMPIYDYRYFNAYDESGTLLSKTASDNKCISVRIPALYNGDIIVKFESPTVWRAAEWISMLCIILCVLEFLWQLCRQKQWRRQNTVKKLITNKEE